MLLVDFIKKGITTLEPLYPTAEARSIIMMLCENVLGTKNYTHIVEPQYKIKKDKQKPLQESLERLKNGEPIQYVIGKTEFCGKIFNVNKNVLIPRPETELLCREAINIGSRIYRRRSPYGNKAEQVKVLDLCTGSGCIAWMLSLSVSNAKVVGVDISEEALEVAKNQNFISEIKEKDIEVPKFIQANILNDIPEELEHNSFDLILSNPPYIMEKEKCLLRKNVLDYEPALALFVSDDDPLIYYRAIAKWSNELLDENGYGLTEVNEVLGKQTETLFKEAGFLDTEIIKDFYDKRRFVKYRKKKAK